MWDARDALSCDADAWHKLLGNRQRLNVLCSEATSTLAYEKRVAETAHRPLSNQRFLSNIPSGVAAADGRACDPGQSDKILI